MTRLRLISTAAALLLVACRPPPAGPLPPSAGLGAPLLARQKVVATHAGVRRGFDAVLQYDGTTLLLLALTPMGTKAFAIRQQDRAVVVESFARGPDGREVPIPTDPTEILRDIHRALFTPTGPTHPDGWQRVDDPTAEKRVGRRPAPLFQRWRRGAVVERIYGPRRRTSSARITYPTPLTSTSRTLPERVELDHPSRDLHLSIHTLSTTPLPPIAH